MIIALGNLVSGCAQPLTGYQEPIRKFDAGLNKTISISYYHMSQVCKADLSNALLTNISSDKRIDQLELNKILEKDAFQFSLLAKITTKISAYDQKIVKLALSSDKDEFSNIAKELSTTTKDMIDIIKFAASAIPGINEFAQFADVAKKAVDGLEKTANYMDDIRTKEQLKQYIKDTAPGISDLLHQMSFIVASAYNNRGPSISNQIPLLYDIYYAYKNTYREKIKQKNKSTIEDAKLLEEVIKQKDNTILPYADYYAAYDGANPGAALAALASANQALINYSLSKTDTGKERNTLADQLVNFELTVNLAQASLDNLKRFESSKTNKEKE